MSASPLQCLIRDKAASILASAGVSMAMVAAFASIANVGVRQVKEGAAMSVFSLSGGAAASDVPEATEPPAPPTAAQPPPAAPAKMEKLPEPQIALLQRPKPGAMRVAHMTAHPVHMPVEARISHDQLREAAERARRADEAARARAAAQAQQMAKAAADAQSQAQAGGGGEDSYTAQVWRHLQRYRRPNSVGAGSTRVRFSIDDRGGVLNVGVARSSGSTRFDHAAVQMVRRAAPFPKPTPGAGRDFIFAIQGS